MNKKAILASFISLFAAMPIARAADADVQAAYDGFVKSGIPGLSIDIVQQAKTEGEVTLYSLVLLDAPVADFRKKFPFIKVNYIPLTGAVLTTRINAERNANKKIQDVIATDEATAQGLVANHQCEAYTPTSDKVFPDNTKIPGVAYRWGATLLLIFYNTTALNAADQAALKHTTWATLMDPRWKGKKFGWVDVNAGFIAGTLPNYYFFSTYGADFYQKHVDIAGRPAMYAGTGPITAALVQNEIDMTGPTSMGAMFPAWQKGAPVAWTTPTPVLAGNAMGCILTGAPHPAAAKLFWEYLLSVEGQTQLATIGNISFRTGFDPNAGLPAKLLSEPWYTAPDVSKIYNYKTDEIIKNAAPMTQAFQRIINGK